MPSEQHVLPADVLRGLTAAEVAERTAAGRTNDVSTKASRTTGEIIRANVFTRINAIYGVLFAIIVSTGYLVDGLFGGLIIVNSAIGMIQELRAKADPQTARHRRAERVWVRRDGEARRSTRGGRPRRRRRTG